MLRPAPRRSSSGLPGRSSTGTLPHVAIYLLGALTLLTVIVSGTIVRRGTRHTPLSSRANVLILLADDLSWAAPGFQGNPYVETRNLDRLAAQGTVLSSFYGCPTCRPARVALLTGRYPARFRVFSTGPSMPQVALHTRLVVPRSAPKLPRGTPTVATDFRRFGYVTGVVGKWQLEPSRQRIPPRRGFCVKYVVGTFRERGCSLPRWAETTEQITDNAIRFIRTHRRRPFFLYVAYHAVHQPLVAPPRLRRYFATKPKMGRRELPEYAAKIAQLDRHIGKLLSELRGLGLDRRTIVVFTSDNGGAGGYDAPPPRIPWPADNRPLRSGKGTLYEGGIRVPFIVRWPERIPSGRRIDVPAHLVDLAPTLLGLTGIKASGLFDGQDLADVLLNRGEPSFERPLFWYAPGYTPHPKRAEVPRWRGTPCEAVRLGKWKLLHFFEDDRVELYNLEEDIGERNNLAAAYPEVTEELLNRLRQWRKDLQLPTPRPKRQSHLAGGDSRVGALR